MAVAGTALIVVAIVALTGSLSGPIHRFTHTSAASAPPTHTSATRSGSQNVQAGSATQEPTPRPTPTDSAHPSQSPDPSSQSRARALCRSYFGYFLHPQSVRTESDQAAERSLLDKLTKAAGGGDFSHLMAYCGSYIRDMLPHWWNQFGQAGPGPQNSPGPASQGH